MATQAIQEYVPLCEVITSKGEKYYIRADKKKSFMDDLEKFKFVNVGDISLASWSVETVRPATAEVSISERMISQFPQDVKEKIRKEIEKRTKEGLKTTPGNIQMMLEKFTTP